MLTFWKKRAEPAAKPPLGPAASARSAVGPVRETFLMRAKRNDSDGAQRRARQLVDQNRLL